MVKRTEIALNKPDLLQKNLQKALNVINKNLKEVGVVENAKMLTSGTFKFGENDSNNINIHTCTSLTQLIKGFAILRNLKKEIEIIAEENKLTTLENNVAVSNFVWCSYCYSAWENDFNIRIKLVANAARIKALQESKAELETFLSADRRLELTLEKIKSII